MRNVVVATVALLVGVAGAGQAAQADNKFDGVYEGTGMILSGRCTRTNSTAIWKVSGNHISAPFGSLRVDADVGPDGKLANGAAAIQTMTKGAITGNNLVMDITSGSFSSCLFHYDLTKRP